MMTLRLWICRIAGHATFPGTIKATCLVYHCPRCRRLVTGGAAAVRR